MIVKGLEVFHGWHCSCISIREGSSAREIQEVSFQIPISWLFRFFKLSFTRPTWHLVQIWVRVRAPASMRLVSERLNCANYSCHLEKLLRNVATYSCVHYPYLFTALSWVGRHTCMQHHQCNPFVGRLSDVPWGCKLFLSGQIFVVFCCYGFTKFCILGN